MIASKPILFSILVGVILGLTGFGLTYEIVGEEFLVPEFEEKSVSDIVDNRESLHNKPVIVNAELDESRDNMYLVEGSYRILFECDMSERPGTIQVEGYIDSEETMPKLLCTGTVKNPNTGEILRSRTNYGRK